jgi:Amt family ammonium transporter
VFAVAAINGVNGLIAGNVRQFGIQVAGVAIAAIYAFVVTYLILKLINLVVPVRVSEEIELKGLDPALHGEIAYAE